MGLDQSDPVVGVTNGLVIAGDDGVIISAKLSRRLDQSVVGVTDVMIGDGDDDTGIIFSAKFSRRLDQSAVVGASNVELPGDDDFGMICSAKFARWLDQFVVRVQVPEVAFWGGDDLVLTCSGGLDQSDDVGIVFSAK